MNRLLASACAVLIAAGGLTPLPPAAQAQSRSVATGATTQMVNLPRGSSMAVDLPTDARDTIISNPQVAEALQHSARRVTIIGLQPGESDAVFLDAAGRTILSLRIRVDAGVGALQDTLARILPGSEIRAEAVNDSIILTGRVASSGEAERAAQVARAFVSGPEKVLNMTTLAGSDQVTLRVRIVEVQRSAVKQLGFDTNAVLGRIDGAQFLFGQAASFGVNGSLLGGLTGGWKDDTTTNFQQMRPCGPPFPDGAMCPFVVRGPQDSSNFDTAQPGTGPGSDGLNKGEATIKAFERVGLVRTLAEPNLTSVNGENASFLAGGEVPVPSGRDRDGQVQVTYKPYGISLSFRPIVLSEGRISLQIVAEVSELSNQGALTIGAGTSSPVTLAAFNTRRVSNTVEMPSGGSMMIAGLLQEQTRQSIDALPGLMSVPILGTLFRSRDYLNGETELVVIVEPYIVSPTSPGRMQTPADGLRIANDAQTILFGQLNQVYGSPAPAARPGAGWQGPVGYVIE